MSAATLTWDADGNPVNRATDGSGTWDTTSVNWYNNTTDVVWPNTTADTAVFGVGTVAPYTVTVGTVNAGAITFNQSGYTLAGGTITLGTGANTRTVTTSGGTDTINSTLALAGGTLTKAGAGTLSIGTTVTGGTAFATVTGGTLNPSLGYYDSVLSIASGATFGTQPGTATTQFTLDAGTLRFTGAGSANGANRTITVTANGGALIDAGGGYNFNDNIAITNNATLYLSNGAGATTNFASLTGNAGPAISGAGANVVMNGLGTAVFASPETYTGSTTVNSGTLSITGSATGVTAATGSISSSSALVLGGGTLSYAPISAGVAQTGLTQTFNGTTINAGASAVNVSAGNTLALGAITHNTGGLISFGTTGTTTASTASNGILGPYAYTGTGAGLSYVTGGGTVAAYTGGTAAVAAAGVTDTTGTANYNVAAGGAVGAGAAVNTLRYTGAADTVSGGINLNGLMNAGTGALTASGPITIGSTRELVVLGNTQNTTISGVIANNGGGASSLTYGGVTAGVLTLGSINTYTGGTVVNGGTLALAAGGGTGAVQGIVTVNPGATLTLSSNDALGYNAGNQVTTVNVNGGTVTSTAGNNEGYLTSYNLNGGTVSAGSLFRFNVNAATPPGISSLASATTSVFGAAIDDYPGTAGGATPGTLAINVGAGTTASGVDLTISGVISQSGGTAGVTGINKTGAGYLNLTGQNTFSGPVTVSAGTLNVGVTAPNAGATGALGLSNAGKTITVNAGATLSGTTTNWFGNQANVGTLPTITVNGGTITTSRYTSIGALNLNGASMTNTDTADTNTYQSFALRGDVAVGGTAASTIATTTASATTGGVHLGANTTFTVADATGNANTDLTVSAPLRDQSGDFGNAVGGFTKAGAGTMMLSGTNTYTGATTVNAGTLLVNNTPGNPLATTSSGTGTGAVTVGNVAGLLTATLGGTGSIVGATTINAGSTITGGTLGAVGTLTLQNTLAITGGAYAVDLSGATTDKLTIGGALTLTNAAIAISGTATPGTYALATYASETGTFAGTLPAGYSLTYGTTELDLMVAAVPEPSTWAVFGLVGLGGFARRRKLADWLEKARC